MQCSGRCSLDVASSAPAPSAGHNQCSMLSSKDSWSQFFRHCSSGQRFLVLLVGSDLLTSEYPEIELHVSLFSGKLFMNPKSIVPSGCGLKIKKAIRNSLNCLLLFFFFLVTGDAVNAIGILSVRKAL